MMLYRIRQRHNDPYLTGTGINADGSTEQLAAKDIELEPEDTTDVQGRDMPTHWSVKIPGKGIDVTVEALNAQAWMNLQIPYWEGPVQVSGSQEGVGYLEMTGY